MPTPYQNSKPFESINIGAPGPSELASALYLQQTLRTDLSTVRKRGNQNKRESWPLRTFRAEMPDLARTSFAVFSAEFGRGESVCSV
jgi:hypothetical protein